MTQAKAVLEHANLTVRDPKATADMLVQLFGWRIRWEGPSLLGGYTVHVGNDDDYLAVYAPTEPREPAKGGLYQLGALNHIGIVVDDLDAAEERVKALGFEPHNHGDYEPGRRFYFHDHDGVEFEVVSYRDSFRSVAGNPNAP
ncbi:MAG: VOC family protein [Pseudomonadota bacterium]